MVSRLIHKLKVLQETSAFKAQNQAFVKKSKKDGEEDVMFLSVQEAIAIRTIIEQSIGSINPSRAVSRLFQVSDRAVQRFHSMATSFRTQKTVLKQGLKQTRDEWLLRATNASDRIVNRLLNPATPSTDLSRVDSSLQASTSAPSTPTRRSSPATSAAIDPAALPRIVGSEGPLRDAAIFTVGLVSRALMQGLNTTVVHGQEHLQRALERPAAQGLVTVSNHAAALDDPLVTAAILPLEKLSQPQHLRWTLCATDRCFTNPLASAFFRTVKVLPVERGAGLVQPGMAAAEQLLRQGEWVHIFPEGTRRASADLSVSPIKPGVGRLVAAAAESPLEDLAGRTHVQLPVTPARRTRAVGDLDRSEGREGSAADASVATEGPLPPLVLPFVHVGMDRVQPKGRPVPSCGKTVHVLVGPPIDVEDLLQQHRGRQLSDRELYSAIADRVGETLHGLRLDLAHRLERQATEVDLDRTEAALLATASSGGSKGSEAAGPSTSQHPPRWGRRLEFRLPSPGAGSGSFRLPEGLVASALSWSWTQNKWGALESQVTASLRAGSAMRMALRESVMGGASGMATGSIGGGWMGSRAFGAS